MENTEQERATERYSVLGSCHSKLCFLTCWEAASEFLLSLSLGFHPQRTDTRAYLVGCILSSGGNTQGCIVYTCMPVCTYPPI